MNDKNHGHLSCIVIADWQIHNEASIIAIDFQVDGFLFAYFVRRFLIYTSLAAVLFTREKG
jgi:hypothetical protein